MQFLTEKGTKALRFRRVDIVVCDQEIMANTPATRTLSLDTILRKEVLGRFVYHREDEMNALREEVYAASPVGIYSAEQEARRIALQSEGGQYQSYSLSVVFAGLHDAGMNMTTLSQGGRWNAECAGMTLQEVCDTYGEENVHYENGLSAGEVFITEWAFRQVHGYE